MGINLRTFKLLSTLKSLEKYGEINNIDIYFDIAETFGIFLHHDCITGTAKRYVDEDYFKRIDRLNSDMN